MMLKCSGTVNPVGSGFYSLGCLCQCACVRVCVCVCVEQCMCVCFQDIERQTQSLTSHINHTLGLIDLAQLLRSILTKALKQDLEKVVCWVHLLKPPKAAWGSSIGSTPRGLIHSRPDTGNPLLIRWPVEVEPSFHPL